LQGLCTFFRKVMTHLRFEQVGKLGYHYDMKRQQLKEN
jgi:hypothetical protein